MSLNEKKCTKQLPDIYLTEGICRSRSFGGLSHRRTNSADATFSSGIDFSFDGNTTKTLYSTVGTTYCPSSSLSSSKNLPWAAWIHAIKSSKSGKFNRSPRPERTQIIFDSICKGLKDSILLAKNDISSSRLAFDNVSVSSVMQMKAGERYLKKLEFHLSKLEELKEQYDVQHKIRDGIRSMGYAYILSPGKLKDMALQSVKSEFKECTEVMCNYESNLESLMGTLMFEMIGIQGFARICCGDVFEVIIKHGDQKWKTRGRVIKNGDQLWENKSVSFKSLFDEPLCIKAMEVRGLGKNILLGNKFCETRDLFCAHPQQMTINLNPSGSLKLNLIITWNPLNGTSDGTHTVVVPSSTGICHSYGRHSISQSSIQETHHFSDISLTEKQSLVHDLNICDNTDTSCSNESISTSALNSGVESPSVDKMTKPYKIVDCSISNENSSIAKNDLLLPKNSNLNDSWSIPTPDENSETEAHTVSSSDQNLTEVIKSLSIILEDISEPYQEIRELSTMLEELEKTLKGKSDSTSGSSISISIESALGCFDFLNTAIDNEENENANDPPLENSEIRVLDRCLKCDGDMMVINEIDKRLSKTDIHPLSISSGKEDVDLVLTDHLLYCTRLVSSLNSAGPFKCIEETALRKIRKQQTCLDAILNILKQSNFCLCNLFKESEEDIHQIWTRICGNGLYCVADHFSFEMENELRSIAVLDSYMASIVSPRLVSDILDSSHFDPTSRISVFQFKSYFTTLNRAHSMILEFVADSLAAEDLKCKDVQKAFYAVSVLSKIVPSSYSLFYVGCLLTDSNPDLKNVAVTYLKAVCTNEDLRLKVISSFLKMLQSGNISTKLVSCKALEVLKAKHCIEQLAYVADTDNDVNVRDAARCVLRCFEEDSSPLEKT